VRDHHRDDGRQRRPILFVLRTGCNWNSLNVTGICHT